MRFSGTRQPIRLNATCLRLALKRGAGRYRGAAHGGALITLPGGLPVPYWFVLKETLATEASDPAAARMQIVVVNPECLKE